MYKVPFMSICNVALCYAFSLKTQKTKKLKLVYHILITCFCGYLQCLGSQLYVYKLQGRQNRLSLTKHNVEAILLLYYKIYIVYKDFITTLIIIIKLYHHTNFHI